MADPTNTRIRRRLVRHPQHGWTRAPEQFPSEQFPPEQLPSEQLPPGQLSPGQFPQFALLPAELRDQVWKCFCAATTANSRVLDFKIRCGEFRSPWKAVPGPLLAQSVRCVNATLAINRECRRVALKNLPDTLSLAYGKTSGTIRFDKTKDIVAVSVADVIDKGAYFKPHGGPFHELKKHRFISGFSENIHHLALVKATLDYDGEIFSEEDRRGERNYIWGILATFRNLKTLYEILDSRLHTPKELAWCALDGRVNVCHVEYSEKLKREHGWQHIDPGMLKRKQPKIPVTMVWLNQEHHRDLALEQALPQARSVEGMAAKYTEKSVSPDRNMPSWFSQVELWPIMQFRGQEGQRMLALLRETPVAELPDGSGSGSGSDVLDGISRKSTVDEDFYSHDVDGFTDIERAAPDSGKDVRSVSPQSSVCSDDLPPFPYGAERELYGYYCLRDSTYNKRKRGCAERKHQNQGFSLDADVEDWLEDLPTEWDQPVEFFGIIGFKRKGWVDGMPSLGGKSGVVEWEDHRVARRSSWANSSRGRE